MEYLPVVPTDTNEAIKPRISREVHLRSRGVGKCSPEGEKARAFLWLYWEGVNPKREAFHGVWPLPKASPGLPYQVRCQTPEGLPPAQRGRSHGLETEGTLASQRPRALGLSDGAHGGIHTGSAQSLTHSQLAHCGRRQRGPLPLGPRYDRRRGGQWGPPKPLHPQGCP